MTDDAKPATRRTLLIGAATLAGLPLLAEPRQARAAGLPKANAKYQDHPNGANKCDICTYYIAGAKPSAAGTCKVVAGPIAPNAWCILFAPKPH
ncbi:MAG TPA: hypothetical protein VKQ54_02070 [Caulobacteraceae bacterium]|nr:hypothetical protein [Caulobacteraceae bacterium]